MKHFRTLTLATMLIIVILGVGAAVLAAANLYMSHDILPYHIFHYISKSL